MACDCRSNDDTALVDQLLDQAARSPDAPTTVLSVLRLLSNHIYCSGQDSHLLYSIRVVATDGWLDSLADEIEARAGMSSMLDGEEG